MHFDAYLNYDPSTAAEKNQLNLMQNAKESHSLSCSLSCPLPHLHCNVCSQSSSKRSQYKLINWNCDDEDASTMMGVAVKYNNI